MAENAQEERIYITYKTRMTTEARLRSNARLWHGLLSYYAFCMILYSLIELSGNYSIANSQVIMAALSVGTFGLSLYISGERYQERADQFKNCYLRLQALYNNKGIPIDEKMARYAEILDLYENQSDDDYDEMLFDTFLRRQKLSNTVGEVEIPKNLIFRVGVRRLARKGFAFLLFAAPLAVGYALLGAVQAVAC